MVRPTDLQDNLSKTQAVERIFDSLRQHHDNEQRNFAQQVQQNLRQEKESIEQLQGRDQLKLSTDLEKEHTREEPLPQPRKERKKKKSEDEPRPKSGDSSFDIIV